MTRLFYLFLVLALSWVLLSGHYTPLLLALGGASCLGVALLNLRMDRVDGYAHPLHLRPLRFLRYLGWLLKEVVKSNIDVATRIVHPRLPISPSVIKVKTSQRSELGQVIYANSITLTPGTVSIDLKGDEIEVHALAREAAAELLQGDMDRRITITEHIRPGDPLAGEG